MLRNSISKVLTKLYRYHFSKLAIAKTFNLSSVSVLISRWTLRKRGFDVDIYVGEWGVNEEDGMTRDSRG